MQSRIFADMTFQSDHVTLTFRPKQQSVTCTEVNIKAFGVSATFHSGLLGQNGIHKQHCYTIWPARCRAI